MKSKRQQTRITVPGRDAPKSWRSSWLRRNFLVQPNPGATLEPAQVLAVHQVPAQTVAIVRRLEACPFRLTKGKVDDLDLPALPDWWHDPNGTAGALEWDWGWNVGRLSPDDQVNGVLPGFIRWTPLGWGPSLFGPVTWEWSDKHQRLTGYPQTSVHHTTTRYVVEGPSLIWLVAFITTGRPPAPNENVPDLPFGESFGSMEGVDVPADAFHKSPARWLIP